MKYQKIPTWLGVTVIIIFAITVGVFAWQIYNIDCVIRVNQYPVQQVKRENIKKEVQIDTNNWKTCVSKKYGYQFKYPNEWSIHVPVNKVITDCNDQTSLVLMPNLAEESLQKVTFSLINNEPALEDFIFQNKSEIEIEKELSINGTRAIIYKKDGPRGEMKIIKLFGDGMTYSFSAENLPSDFFETLTSTIDLKEEVSFCGNRYKTERIILDDTDVIKRIADFSKNNAYRICENIATDTSKETLSVKFFKQEPTDVDYKDGVYFLNIGMQFKIDLNKNSIYILGGYDGTPTYIGKLK